MRASGAWRMAFVTLRRVLNRSSVFLRVSFFPSRCLALNNGARASKCKSVVVAQSCGMQRKRAAQGHKKTPQHATDIIAVMRLKHRGNDYSQG